jgi:hypothetical protein
MTTSIQVPSTSSFMNHSIIQCNILLSSWQCQNNKQKNKAADLFYLTWVGFIYQMLIFGEGRVQCMKVSKKMLYVGQKTHNWNTGPPKTHHNILTCIQRLDSANVSSLALDSAIDCRMQCSQLPICIVITSARPATRPRYWCSIQNIGFVNMSTTATRPVVTAAKHNQYSRNMWKISEHLKKYVQYVLWGRGGH